MFISQSLTVSFFFFQITVKWIAYIDTKIDGYIEVERWFTSASATEICVFFTFCTRVELVKLARGTVVVLYFVDECMWC